MAATNPMTRLPALRRVPIFQGLSKEALFDVARRTNEVSYPAGSVLVCEGDPGDSLGILVEGTVEVRKGDRVIAQMHKGDFFGEIALIDGAPRTASVVAVDDVVLLTLTTSDFAALLAIPYVARTALRSLAARVREAHGSRLVGNEPLADDSDGPAA